MLVSGLPYLSKVDDMTIMLRDGDLMGSFIVEGINADTVDHRHTMELSNALSRFIAQQRADVAYYIHRISVETRPTIAPLKGHPFNEEIDLRVVFPPAINAVSELVKEKLAIINKQ